VALGVAGASLGCSSDSAPPVTLDAQATKGQQIAKDRGCISCHTASGNRSEGPTWKGLYGHPVTLTDGTTVTADDAYIARSISDPSAQVVSGFNPEMPKNNLSADEIAAVTAYIKALA
jgi:cytochrome c oxidase subunit 2